MDNEPDPAGQCQSYCCGEVPYGFGVVELDGGLRVITRLTETCVERLRPGLDVRLVLEPLFTEEDGTIVLGWAFRPETA